MSIKRLIAEEIPIREEIVEHKGDTYTLVGGPDARILCDTLWLSSGDEEKWANHWKTVLGLPQQDEIPKELVSKVFLVSRLLQHEDDPVERYDASQICAVALRDAPLFNALLGAAFKIIGFAAESGDSMEDVALAGESQGSAAEPESSTSS